MTIKQDGRAEEKSSSLNGFAGKTQGWSLSLPWEGGSTLGPWDNSRKTVRSLQDLLPVYSWQLQGQVPGFPWCISMGTAQQPRAGRCTPSISMAPITMAPTCSEKTQLKTEHKKEGGQSASPELPSPAAAVIPVIALTGLSSSRFWFCCLCS